MAGRKDKFDWPIFALFSTLVIIGWLMQYAVGHDQLEGRAFMDTNVGRHTMWVGISFFVFILGQVVDARFWRTLAYPIYGLSLILLLLVLIVGVELKGARSWFMVGGLSFQPSEFAKLGTILALSGYLSSFKARLKGITSQLVAIGLITFPALLILLQPDAGSALVFLSFFVLFFREGMPTSYYGVAIFAVITLLSGLLFPVDHSILVFTAFIVLFFAYNLYRRVPWSIIFMVLTGVIMTHIFVFPLSPWIWAGVLTLSVLSVMYQAWSSRQRVALIMLPSIVVVGIALSSLSNFVFYNILEPHQQDRINVWLRPSQCDPQGALYNIIQSKVAIGSGGFVGKGFLEGSMTRLKFVPEQETDFIFSTIGEEQGFVGALAVIVLYLGLIMRIVFIGENRENAFIRTYGYGLAGVLFFHFFVNIGMTMGLVPVVGIPLPLISKGGSAMVLFSLMISVFIRLSKSRL